MQSERKGPRAGRVGRRDFLGLAGAAGAATLLPAARPAPAGSVGGPKLLFVIAAQGGASIIDSFLPVAESQAGAAAPLVNAYPDASVVEVPGAAFRCVANAASGGLFSSGYDLRTFVSRHKDDMVVVAQEVTSVTHAVAQQRALTGAGVDGGRTIQEAVAEAYGAAMAVPNVTFASAGYADGGSDPSVSPRSRPEPVAAPLLFALSTHGSAGVAGAPGADAIARARAARTRAEAASPFVRHFGGSRLVGDYGARRDASARLEASGAIATLMLAPRGQGAEGLAASPYAGQLREAFPGLDKGDNLAAQAATGFLLARYGLSCAITIGPGDIPSFGDSGATLDTPLAFDFSHVDHRACQQTMWGRLMQVVDGLVTLLKQEDYLGDPALGKMWQRSLVYVATDFGRTKARPAGATAFPTGHDFNNGNVLLSPLLKGNRVFGGVDPATCRTYGFDLATGAPTPGALVREGDLYSAIAQALGVDFPGRLDVSALVRA